MLRFFNRIRKQLAKDNKLFQYSRYAVGEIVLLVIGILIALNINNWNDRTTRNELTKVYLSNLSKSVLKDTDNLKRIASLQEFRFNSLQYLLDLSSSRLSDFDNLPKDDYPIIGDHVYESSIIWAGQYPDTINYDFLNLTVQLSVVTIPVEINSSVLDEMINTGLFANIGDEALKRTIMDYYAFVEAYFLNEDWNQDLTSNWREYLRNNYNIVARVGIESQEQEFINLMQSDLQCISRTKEMVEPARYRANNAYLANELGQKVISMIEQRLSSGLLTI
jgi:hypothetical protein